MTVRGPNAGWNSGRSTWNCQSSRNMRKPLKTHDRVTFYLVLGETAE
jgi:hypothetical protein